jgi:hypothetical protein
MVKKSATTTKQETASSNGHAVEIDAERLIHVKECEAAAKADQKTKAAGK